MGQVRVTLYNVSNLSSITYDHVSIGVGTGASVGTTATPVELLFSGGHGVTVAPGATLASDWANLTFAISDELIVDLDVNSGSTSAQYQGITNGEGWFAPGGSQYNTASGASFFDNGAIVFGISLIETKS